MSEQKSPLWEVLRNADLLDPFCTVPESYAEMIRAMRDWLVPEEDKPNDEFCCPPVSTMLWRQKMDLRALLTAEADRAERGDQSTSQEH